MPKVRVPVVSTVQRLAPATLLKFMKLPACVPSVKRVAIQGVLGRGALINGDLAEDGVAGESLIAADGLIARQIDVSARKIRNQRRGQVACAI